MDFAYYFLAAGTHTETKADKGSGGWCLEFTSHEQMAEYVRSSCNFPTIFAARTQGLSVEKVVENVTGKKTNLVIGGVKKPSQPADVIKGKLTKALRQMLGEPSFQFNCLLFSCSLMTNFFHSFVFLQRTYLMRTQNKVFLAKKTLPHGFEKSMGSKWSGFRVTHSSPKTCSRVWIK